MANGSPDAHRSLSYPWFLSAPHAIPVPKWNVEMQQSSLPVAARRDGAGGAVDGDTLARLDALGGAGDADHGRDAVFAGDDRAVRDRPAHLHHQPTGGEEERRPPRVGG